VSSIIAHSWFFVLFLNYFCYRFIKAQTWVFCPLSENIICAQIPDLLHFAN